MKDKRLLPCPFCGADANMWQTNYATYIDCSKTTSWHKVQISAKTEEQAIAWWNNRKGEQE